MFELLLAVTLSGTISNAEGRVGIKLTGNKIIHVYNHSPAAKYLQENDIVISSDGRKGTWEVLGPVGSYVEIVIKRGDETKTFYIQRDSWSRVYDSK